MIPQSGTLQLPSSNQHLHVNPSHASVGFITFLTTNLVSISVLFFLDEPSMKAPFKISLISPDTDGYHALSNMDQEGEPEPFGDGLVKVNFRESVPMSTYLTVFIVSDFENVSRTIVPEFGDPFLLRCFSTPAQVKKLDFALQTSVDVIQFYISYFKIAYPLPKLDLAAIPDFVR